MKKNTKKSGQFCKYLAFVLIVITIINLGLFKFINVLPNEYFWVLVILQVLINIVLLILLLNKKPKKRIVGASLSLIYIVILVLLIIYLLNTIDFLKKLGFTNFKTENYLIVTKTEEKYKDLKDLKNLKIGSLEFKEEGIKNAKTKVEAKIEVEFITYSDALALKEGLSSDEVSAILIEESLYNIILEDNPELNQDFKIVYNFDVEVEEEDITKDVDIVNTPFNIYISGIDTYGKVSSASRSDVNMLITVNAKDGKILITSIPRDYYVLLDGKGNDKLTHAGIYGVDSSIKALENLLDTNINYYIKVNFTSLIKIVDALDGVSVYSNYNFTSIDGYRYQKGYNNVDGKKALSFVRERKAFMGGDRVRIENQAHMIEALLNKAISPSIIIKYNELLNALSKSFITNISMEDITKFIKMQIDTKKEWQVLNISLDGTDRMDYTYTYPRQKLYVMEPNMETVTDAQAKIKEYLKS